MSYLDTSSFDSSLYYPHSANEDPSLAISFGLDHPAPFSNNVNHNLNLTTTSHDSPRSFPTYDQDSPFNSPVVPIRTIGKDGRLKTKLMGVGTEGGYLTSPLIVGGKRMGNAQTASNSNLSSGLNISRHAPNSLEGGSKLSIGSPTSVPMTSSDSFGSVSGLGAVSTLSLSRVPSSTGMSSVTAPGIGMGIVGVDDLIVDVNSLESLQGPQCLDPVYVEDDEPTPRAKTPTQSVRELPMSPTRPPRSAGPGGSLRKAPHRAMSPIPPVPPMPGIIEASTSTYTSSRFNEPPPVAQIQEPATGHRHKRDQPVRTVNRAKSCSALSPHAQPNGYAHEPLTPVSAHSPSFIMPGVPFNSPLDGELTTQQGESNDMPFSFSDLYNFGLSVDSTGVDELTADLRKHPYTFANQLIGAENEESGGKNAPEGLGIGLGMGPNGGYQEEHDYSAVHSLPTPYLVHGSGFSTPATDYLNAASPEMYRSPSHYSATSMATAPSMMSMQSMDGPYNLAPPQAGRQRTTYSDTVSGSSTMQHRQLSSTSAYGPSAKFAYPMRFQQGQQQAPPMQWANSVPPGSTVQQLHQTYIRNHSLNGDVTDNYEQSNMFIPLYAGPHQVHSDHVPRDGIDLDAYERNLEAFDEMYGRSTMGPRQATVYATPGKRRRELDDDDGADYEHIELEDDDREYVPGGGEGRRARANGGGSGAAPTTPQNKQSTHKRLRTVASAPCLPTRRLRPGPKPKPNKSPGQQHESVFRAEHLSPPPALPFRRGTSPLDASPRRSGAGGGATTDDEDDDGQGGSGMRGSLPKEVIESLYNSIPSHMDSHGNKVAKKYECLMEGCGRTFPRKSAIESHIQTHLEDKPFYCSQPDW